MKPCQYFDGQIYSNGDCVFGKDGYCIFCGKYHRSKQSPFPFDEILNADWCDHGFDSQNDCPICNVDLMQAMMDRR